MKRFWPLVAGTLLFISWPLPDSQAADAERRFAVKGVGRSTCADFLAAQKERSRQYFLYGGWLGGYITALNQNEADTFDLASWQTTDLLALSMTAHCRQYPDKAFYLAAYELAIELRKTRLTENSPLIEATAGDQKIRIYQETMRRAQQKLNEQGYAVGTPDGAFGAQTEKALRAFQKASKLQETGLPDQPTLMRLFYGKPEE